MKVCHQAVDSVTKAVYTWQADAYDPTGVHYPGPNSPTHIVVTAGFGFSTNLDAGAGLERVGSTIAATTQTINGQYDLIVRSATKDPAVIQAALDALPSNGGNIFIEPGTWVLTSNLHCYGKSNVHIYGAGRGKTILDMSGISDFASNPNWLGHSGALSISSHASGGSGATGIVGFRLSGITIKDTRTAAPYSAGDVRNGHSLAIDNCSDVIVSECEMWGGVAEQIYITGAAGVTVSRHVYSHCYFHNTSVLQGTSTPISGTTGACIDTNTSNVNGIQISDCQFAEISAGILLLGRNNVMTGLVFHRAQAFGIECTEDNGGSSGKGAIISNCTFTELGKYSTANSVGIEIGNSSEHYEGGFEDDMPIVSNVTFVDNVAAGTGIQCVSMRGPTKLHNVHVGPILATDYNASCADQAFTFVGTAHGNACPLVFSGCRIKQPAAVDGDSFGFRTGLLVGAIAELRISVDASNDWDVGGGASANYALLFGGTAEEPYPEITLAGPRLRGRYVIDRRTTYNADGALDEHRPWGKSNQNLSTQYAGNIGGIASHTVGNVLDVTGLSDIYMNDAGAATIILMTGGIESQIVRLHFVNTNTTIQYGAGTIVLDGAVDAVSAAGAFIELQRRSGIWYEMRRKGM